MAFSVWSWLIGGRERGESSSTGAARGVRPAGTSFHAVSIRPGVQSCEAARQFGKLRFLSARAPRLPLPECRAAECHCHYTHHADRRSGRDRRQVYAPLTGRADGVERRRTQGRRSTDPVA